MAYQHFWAPAQQNFTANGGQNGGIQVSNPAGFFVTAYVALTSNTLTEPKVVQIKKIVTESLPYTIFVGPLDEKDKDLAQRVDVSAFLLSDAAVILQPLQKIPQIKEPYIPNFVYERDPVKAFRVEPVDAKGNPISATNPLPVATGGGGIAPASFGDVKATYDSNGNVTQYSFYAKTILQGYIIISYDSNGNQVDYQGYDASGNPL